MKSTQLTHLIAAPLASLFLMLSLCTFRTEQPQSRGQLLILTKLVSTCGDGREIFFNLRDDQSAEVNQQKMPILEAVSFVDEIMSHRAERMVYFSASANMPMKDVIDGMSRLRHASSDLLLASVTSKQLSLLTNQLTPSLPGYIDEGKCIVPIAPYGSF